MGKRGNLGSNVSDESWRGQRWEGRDRGSQHRSSQHRSSQHSHTAEQHRSSQHRSAQQRFFETAQTARAASIAATCQAESLTLPWYQNPTVVNLAKQRLKRRAERRHLKQCFRKGRRWRQPRR